MESAVERAEALRQQIAATEKELDNLKMKLAQVEASIQMSGSGVTKGVYPELPKYNRWPLSPEEYSRYGRQMIVPSIGIEGQLRLRSASVLIIGAGGLGCPAAAYIAGAGVKTLGIVDGDTVELSNLHRQILHTTSNIGTSKVDSAIQSLRRLNPTVTYKSYPTDLTHHNAATIVSDYDIVLDCTDHPKTRYLISDICILLCKPLISASALRTDGQLTILNAPSLPQGSAFGGPCYRCIFPKPPPATQVLSCGEGGILGPVVGVMGVLQALETIKLLVAPAKPPSPALLIFSANDLKTPFRKVRLRGRRKNCFACTTGSTLTLSTFSAGSFDYEKFCGLVSPVNILPPSLRIPVSSYFKIRESDTDHILIDVREKVHFDLAALDGAVNMPISDLMGKGFNSYVSWLENEKPVYVVCKQGNDSQIAVQRIKDEFQRKGIARGVWDVRGGLDAWRATVDETFPVY